MLVCGYSLPPFFVVFIDDHVKRRVVGRAVILQASAVCAGDGFCGACGLVC